MRVGQLCKCGRRATRSDQAASIGGRSNPRTRAGTRVLSARPGRRDPLLRPAKAVVTSGAWRPSGRATWWLSARTSSTTTSPTAWPWESKGRTPPQRAEPAKAPRSATF